MKLFLSLLFFMCFFKCTIICAQKMNAMEEKIDKNRDLALKDPEQYKKNLEDLLKIAVKTKNHRAELRLLGQRCWYYNHKLDLDNSLKSIGLLQKKATEYKDLYHQALAHQYSSYMFAKNNLPDQSITEYKEAINILNQLDSNQQDIRYSKMNVYLTVSNAYIEKKDYAEVASVSLKASKEIEQFTDKELKRQMHFLNYSNLGGFYAELGNRDSAVYFVQKSMKLRRKNEENSTPQFQNYMTLGIIAKNEKKISVAIENLRKAENIASQIKPELENVLLIYNALSELYKDCDSLDLSNSYIQKSNVLQLQIEKNRNKSLHTIINDGILEDKRTIVYVTLGLSFIIIVLLGISIHFRRKSKLLIKQEKQSQEYLMGREKFNDDLKDFSKLVEMAKKKDPAFLVAFRETYPYFVEKILAVNPKIVHTELEFCALMKLNLPTKEIAKILSIEPKSVRAKKYRIRKKLNIEDDAEIYSWFNQI
ncbi:MAG: hypothetical protein DI529_10680 [Chryseobacterium sp.]|nr:MAG: hypothetical protein DI529_10680 [Chryseobacterium sp.]